MMGVKVREKPRGSGVWWVFINHQGQRQSKRVGKKGAAEEVAEVIEAELKLDQYDFNKNKPQKTMPTFELYAQGFMDTYSKLYHKPSTRESYQGNLDNHLMPFFGDMELDQITRRHIKEFIQQKQTSGLSAGSVKILQAYLSKILSEAVDDELIPANPAVNTRKNIAKEHKEEINPLTAAELNHLLETVKERYSKHYSLFLLLARTGMRIGEALALQWGDVDFSGRFIEVRRAVVRGIVSTPKNGKSRRVDMSPQLAGALRVHLTASRKKGLALGMGEPEIVFTNRIGNMVDINNWRRRVFNKALEKAELRKIRIHDLRHTYATLRIAAGHNISDVSNQLGHHSVKVTLDVYSHWLPGQNKAEVDALDNLHLTAPYPHPEAAGNKKADPKARLSS